MVCCTHNSKADRFSSASVLNKTVLLVIEYRSFYAAANSIVEKTYSRHFFCICLIGTYHFAAVVHFPAFAVNEYIRFNFYKFVSNAVHCFYIVQAH